MHNNTAMPIIDFGPGTDYESLFTLLHLANEGLGGSRGLLLDFHIAGGGQVTGSFATDCGDDDMVIAMYEDDEYATVDTDLIEKLTYL